MSASSRFPTPESNPLPPFAEVQLAVEARGRLGKTRYVTMDPIPREEILSLADDELDVFVYSRTVSALRIVLEGMIGGEMLTVSDSGLMAPAPLWKFWKWRDYNTASRKMVMLEPRLRYGASAVAPYAELNHLYVVVSSSKQLLDPLYELLQYYGYNPDFGIFDPTSVHARII